MRTFLAAFGLVGSAEQSPVTFPCSFDVSTQATRSLLRGDAGGPSVTDAPSVPDLLNASDSGTSDTDNITNVTEPVFRVGLPAQAVASDAMRVYHAGSVEIGTALLDGTDIGNGYVDVTASPLASGAHAITARVENGAGLSPASGALALTVDTAAPDAPGAIDLAAASDSGSSATDDITNDDTPTIDITLPANVVAGDLLELREGTTVLASKTLDGADISAGVVGLTSSSLSDGAHTLDARVTDAAGNVGTDSAGLTVTIDTAAPSAPTAIVVTPADQGGSALQTENTQPTFRISLPGDAVATDVVTLEIDTADDATATLDGTDISNGYVDIQSANVLADDALYDISAFIADVAGNEGPSNTPVEIEVGTAANAIPAVIYDGVGDHLLHSGGPAGVADGAELTVVWAGTFNSDGSPMTLLDIPGTVPVQLIRQSDNTIDFVGGTAGAVFSNSTAAVAASLGFLIILASCNGTTSTLKVVHAGGTITGTPTAGSTASLDLTADWYLGSNGGSGNFLDADTALWWLDDAEIDFTDADNIEQFWDTTNDLLRDPGADGSNPIDGAGAPLICHRDFSSTHAVNVGSGGDADGGSNSGDGVSPGNYAENYSSSNTVGAIEFLNPSWQAYDWSNPGPSGISDSGNGSFVVWYKLNTLPSATNRQVIFSIESGAFNFQLHLRIDTDDKVRLYSSFGGNPGDIVVSNVAETLDGNWHCLMASYDSDISGGGVGAVAYLYRDGIDVLTGSLNFHTSTPDYTRPVHIGGHGWESFNRWDYEGQLAMIWYDDTQVLDFSDSTIRDKFYDAGKFVDVGVNGQLPTGTAPLICLKGNTATFGSNVGLANDPSDDSGGVVIDAIGPVEA